MATWNAGKCRDMPPEKADFFAVLGHRPGVTWVSGFVLAQVGDAGDVNFLTLHDDQTQVAEFVQDA